MKITIKYLDPERKEYSPFAEEINRFQHVQLKAIATIIPQITNRFVTRPVVCEVCTDRWVVWSYSGLFLFVEFSARPVMGGLVKVIVMGPKSSHHFDGRGDFVKDTDTLFVLTDQPDDETKSEAFDRAMAESGEYEFFDSHFVPGLDPVVSIEDAKSVA